MPNKTQGLILLGAILICVLAGSFYFYIQSLPSATSTRVEEPYKREADKPPSAVKDETSAPDL